MVCFKNPFVAGLIKYAIFDASAFAECTFVSKSTICFQLGAAPFVPPTIALTSAADKMPSAFAAPLIPAASIAFAITFLISCTVNICKSIEDCIKFCKDNNAETAYLFGFISLLPYAFLEFEAVSTSPSQAPEIPPSFVGNLKLPVKPVINLAPKLSKIGFGLKNSIGDCCCVSTKLPPKAPLS